jgi:subtilase family serine protease
MAFMKRFSPGNLFLPRIALPFMLFAIALSLLPAIATKTFAANNHVNSVSHVAVRPNFRPHFKLLYAAPTPPTDAQCRAKTGYPCYSPQEIRNAYGVTALLDAGYTGKGQSIVIIDSYGSPTIRQDLRTFDVGYGLPDPPSFKILAPYERMNLPQRDQRQLKGYRGLPDISWNADPYTSILIYASFIPNRAGYSRIGGTSEGSPQLAGVIADFDQLAGYPLGFINPVLYELGNSSRIESFHGITAGNNGYNGVRGYSATSGWDLTTGWGSPKITTLINKLIESIQG